MILFNSFVNYPDLDNFHNFDGKLGIHKRSTRRAEHIVVFRRFCQGHVL